METVSLQIWDASSSGCWITLMVLEVLPSSACKKGMGVYVMISIRVTIV